MEVPIHYRVQSPPPREFRGHRFLSPPVEALPITLRRRIVIRHTGFALRSEDHPPCVEWKRRAPDNTSHSQAKTFTELQSKAAVVFGLKYGRLRRFQKPRTPYFSPNFVPAASLPAVAINVCNLLILRIIHDHIGHSSDRTSIQIRYRPPSTAANHRPHRTSNSGIPYANPSLNEPQFKSHRTSKKIRRTSNQRISC